MFDENNLKLGNTIQDKHGIGKIADFDWENEGFEIGVIFKGEEDNGVWWISAKDVIKVIQ